VRAVVEDADRRCEFDALERTDFAVVEQFFGCSNRVAALNRRWWALAAMPSPSLS
jgi:hypothetical protein